MTTPPTRDELKEQLKDQASQVLKRLNGLCDDVSVAKRLVDKLRDVREYEAVGQLAEAISRHDPADARNRRLYAQYLIDTGKATAAIDMLRPLTRRLAKDHREFAEASGLLGRAHKQIFLDAAIKTDKPARDALKQAINAYRKPFDENPANTWHGVNLVALLTRARRLGLRFASDLEPAEVSKSLVKTLEATPAAERDIWFLPTLAEASLGLGDWPEVERHVRAYAAADDAKAFQVASTLRQFTQLWDLDHTDERGRGLVDMLRARLAVLPGGELELPPGEVQRLRKQPSPDNSQLEAILGDRGPETFQWWKTGIDRAVSVAAIRRQVGGRIGTGFVVRAGDLGLEPSDELLVLTNYHVVNPLGASPGIPPEEAEIVFEASETDDPVRVDKILWSSPPELHDASVLRLRIPVSGIAPVPLAKALPVVEETARVYIIGHPGGRDLAFSFQDNDLLDHEGPSAGKPPVPNVWRVHYRAPTEGGSSGSPVFNSRLWQVIALHHKGGKLGMPRLNGKDGTYAANEGIAIQSIRKAISEA